MSVLVRGFLLLMLVSSFLAAPEARADAVQEDAAALARQRFSRGLESYDQGQFAAALVEFSASVEIYASPNSYLYMGRCHRALERFADAVVNYERSVALATDRARLDPRYEDTAAAARQELAAVVSRVGYVSVQVTAPGPQMKVLVAGKEIPQAAWGLWVPVNAGHVNVSMMVGGVEQQRLELKVAAGEKLPAYLGVPPALPTPVRETAPAASSPGHRTFRYLSVATAVAGLGAFGTFAWLAGRKHDQLESRCPGGSCSTPQEALIDRGRLYQNAANGSLVLGVLGLGAAAWFWSHGAAVSPSVGTEHLALTASGCF
jgi:tetratricopeptide (TPR) repeat protein